MDRGALSTIGVLSRLIVRADLHLRGDLAKGISLECLGVLLATAGPFGLKFAIDNLQQPSNPIGLIALAAAVFVLSWALSTLVGIWRMVYSNQVINVVARALTSEGLEGHLPTTVSKKDADSGKALGAIERLPFSLQTVVDGILWRGCPLIIQLLVTLGMIASLIPLTYIAVLGLTAVVFIFLSWLSAKRYAAVAGAANVAAASVSQLLGDILRNARRVVLNGAISIEVNEVTERYNERLRAERVVVWNLLQMTGIQFGLIAAGLILLLVMGAYDVRAHRITLGDFVLIQTFAFRLIQPLSGFGYTLSQAGIAFANIADVLALKTLEGTKSSSFEHPTDPGRVQLKNVSFSYGPGLNGIGDASLEFDPGSFNLIVGANGSGKSTIAQISAGVLQRQTGDVFVNGLSIDQISPATRHRHILYVPQFVGLFNRTLLANALYPPTTHNVEQLADTLRQLEFYEPGKVINFGQFVGEQGERLSGGQVQKLELARLMGVTAPVLILDESTSALDSLSEGRTIGILRKSHPGTTIVLISHSLRLAGDAGRIVFMDGGEVLAVGTHEKLLESSFAYRQFWQASNH